MKRNSTLPHHHPLPPHHRRCHLNLLFSYLAPWPEEEELPPRHDVIRKKESTAEDLNCPGSRKNSFHQSHNHHTGLHTNFLNSVVKPAFPFGFSKSGSCCGRNHILEKRQTLEEKGSQYENIPGAGCC